MRVYRIAVEVARDLLGILGLSIYVLYLMRIAYPAAYHWLEGEWYRFLDALGEFRERDRWLATWRELYAACEDD